MLVVSNIDLTKDMETMKPAAFLDSSVKDFILNVNNDYRYLKTGYYVSMHAEVLGDPVIPTSRSIIDSSRTPILLLHAEKSGIPVMPHVTTGSIKEIMSRFDFPVVVYAVNPFTYDGFKIAGNRSALYRAVKSLGMNYKFAVCVQPLAGEVISFKSIFGKCELDDSLNGISKKVYEVFRLPICKLHVQRVGKEAFLSGLQPLQKEEIIASDLEMIRNGVSEVSKTVSLVG